MIRVLMGDDHAVVRKGLRQIIEEAGGMQVVAEAVDGDDVLAQLQRIACEVIVLDLSMPGRSGLDIIQEIRALLPELPILVLSVHPEEQYAVRLLKSGIAGYINKETAPDALVGAIRKVAAGGKYVSEALAEKLALGLATPDAQQAHERLSDREYRVLCMLGSGRSVSQIAEELIISVKTVSTYRTRLLEKLNMHTTAELIRYAIENDLK
jgi:DNA-binding NarL/FixJ family response regulator